MTQQHGTHSATDAITGSPAPAEEAPLSSVAAAGPEGLPIKRYDGDNQPENSAKGDDGSAAEQSLRPPGGLVPPHVSNISFVDLIRNAEPPDGPSRAQNDASGHRTPSQAEDGSSAEALLSLMQSVQANREREQSKAQAGVLRTKRASSSSTGTHDRGGEDSSSGDGGGGDHSDGDGDGEETTGKRTPRAKRRKSTHTVRKEEKAVLLDEIKVLEDRLKLLRGQVFLPPKDSEGNEVDPNVSNALLRQAIHEQQLRFAAGRSLLSHYMTLETASPIHTYLHLGLDMAQRRIQLFGIKPTILAERKHFIEQRSKMLDLTRHHAVVERFETNSGDACCIRFYVDQFPNRFTVRDVHDATQFFIGNLEMSITDSLGHITIREDDDSGDPSLSQHRLVVSGGFGIIVETNIVIFSHFNEQENYGIVAVTYVDQDEIHPYRPLERIRQDVMGVSLITQEQDLVVVRRWAHVRMRKSTHVKLKSYVLQAARENLGNWGDAMMQFVRERLYTNKRSAAASAPGPPSSI